MTPPPDQIEGVVAKGEPDDPAMHRRTVDALLVQRFCDGDVRAFEVLVTKYQRRVAALINASVRNASVAEELTQEAFLRAYRSLPGFRFESAFSTWLYAIARNLAASYHRDGHARADAAVSLDGLREDLAPADRSMLEGVASGPEEDLSGKQLLVTIHQAIELLAPAMRDALLLREVDDKSYAEIAAQLDIPLNTVRSLIFRARATIGNAIRPILDNAFSERLL